MLDASKVILVQRHESHVIASPACSITKLGIVRFVLSEEPRSGALALARGVVELRAFSNEERSRPTVQMPPLFERRERPTSRSNGDAFAARQPRARAAGGMTAWMLR